MVIFLIYIIGYITALAIYIDISRKVQDVTVGEILFDMVISLFSWFVVFIDLAVIIAEYIKKHEDFVVFKQKGKK